VGCEVVSDPGRHGSDVDEAFVLERLPDERLFSRVASFSRVRSRMPA